MSVYALILSFALNGQVVTGDRYGTPPGGEPASAGGQPATPNSTQQTSPPPRFTPETNTAPPTSLPTAPPTSPPTALQNKDTAANTKPSALMQSMLVAPPGARLTGRPVRLADVLANASTREEQSRRIDAYWNLSSSVADYYLGVREQDELQRSRSGVTSVGPAWQQAESELGVRIGTSQRAAVASQYRLASLLGDVSESGLPLPSDLPHCGDYYARYDQVFAGRQSPEARELSELLPMRYIELSDAAMAVTRAEAFLSAITSQRSSGDGTGTLRALELLALRRRAFVQIARDYNRRIARYAELASPGQIDADRLIGMLIMRDSATNTATRPTTLVPPPNRQSQVPADDPDQTFAEGWESIKSAAATPRDEAVHPASAESRTPKPRRERSLLVPSE